MKYMNQTRIHRTRRPEACFVHWSVLWHAFYCLILAATEDEELGIWNTESTLYGSSATLFLFSFLFFPSFLETRASGSFPSPSPSSSITMSIVVMAFGSPLGSAGSVDYGDELLWFLTITTGFHRWRTDSSSPAAPFWLPLTSCLASAGIYTLAA